MSDEYDVASPTVETPDCEDPENEEENDDGDDQGQVDGEEEECPSEAEEEEPDEEEAEEEPEEVRFIGLLHSSSVRVHRSQEESLL
jgi:hypothetical protein